MQTFVPSNKGLLYHTTNKDADEAMGNNYERNPVFSISVEAILESLFAHVFIEDLTDMFYQLNEPNVH